MSNKKIKIAAARFTAWLERCFIRFKSLFYFGLATLIALNLYFSVRDTRIYNRLDLSSPLEFSIYHHQIKRSARGNNPVSYWLFGTIRPGIHNAKMAVSSDEYNLYALGDTIQVFSTPSGDLVSSHALHNMHIGHIGRWSIVLDHFPMLLILLLSGGILWLAESFARRNLQ